MGREFFLIQGKNYSDWLRRLIVSIIEQEHYKHGQQGSLHLFDFFSDI